MEGGGMNPFGFLDRRVRGVRVIDLAGAVLLCGLVLVVYMAKTGAGGTAVDIDKVQQQIDEQRGRIRLLQAEVANEEQPERLASLSGQLLNLQPISPKHEIPSEDLADIVHAPPPKPVASAAAPPPAPVEAPH
jgi:cell division protein FtsL